MKKLIEIMSEFGAEFLPKNKFNFPLKLISTEMPVCIKYKAGVSAQLKSAVILAGLNSFGTTEIIEDKKSRDHTENMLIKNSQAIKIKKRRKKLIKIYGKKYLNRINIDVPGDPSSAAFFVALTLLNNNSSLKIKNVGLNPTRIGFYELLKKHGANIKFYNKRKRNNEITGDITIKSGKLKKPINASKNFYEKTTDEFPMLFCIAALTKGISVFKGIEDLANKESNRIKEMQNILKQIGIKSIATKNKIKIYGKNFIETKNKNMRVPNLGDHRICMSSMILSLITGIKTKINNFETVKTSSPNFLKIIKSLGAKFETYK
jgi:3-phosphoshikimate 1-carboxyvinyltransferase